MTYLEISQKINAAVNDCVGQGATVDEVFAALSTLKEVWNIRLAQAVLDTQQRGNDAVAK